MDLYQKNNAQMRKVLILMLAAVSATLLAAQNYFVEGTRWVESTWSTAYPQPTSGQINYYIAGDTIINGIKALKLYEGTDAEYSMSEGRLRAIIRTEGDKVWVKKSKVSNEWGLLYDFGLKPGEGCDLVRSNYYEGTNEPETIHVQCTNVRPSESHPGIEEMVIQPIIEDLVGVDPSDIFDGVWYKGIGSEEDLLTCNAMFKPVGGGAWLSEVWYKGEQVFCNNPSGIETMSTTPIPYKIKGRDLLCEPTLSADIAVYTVDGKCIYTQPASQCNYKFPHSGMYIIRANERVTSVMVR